MQRWDEGLAFMLKYENVAWYEDGMVRILDRRVYPRQVKFVECRSHKEVAQAITDMVTQSAGPYTAAAMGMALAARECEHMSYKQQKTYLKNAANRIASARPTTKNRMEQIVKRSLKAGFRALDEGKKVDEAIFEDSLESLNRRYEMMSKLAENLVDMFPDKGKIMTQCFGETIVGTMLREARKRGKKIEVFCPETRPYLQGARLTASVCQDQGFDTTIITDNMPAATMMEKDIDLFTSAADSIVLDGHVVNKVGTLQIALAAHYFDIPYFVTGIPDRGIEKIDQIKIEERDPREVLEFAGIKTAMKGVKGYYPSFDITPAKLISGVVTDKGIYSPYDLKKYFQTEVKDFY